MNLKELGELFRAERERKGLSIADVVQRTKISKTNVLALEAGDPSRLPHPVYAKGFVRNYARLVGLDPETCVAVMAEQFVAEDNVSVPQPSLDGPDQEILPPRRGKSGLGVFLAGILAIVLLAGGVFLLTSRQEASRPAPAEQPAAQEQPQEQAPEQSQEQSQGQESQPSEAVPQPGEGEAPQGADAPAAPAQPDQGAQEQAPAQPEAAAPAPAPAAPAAAQPSAPAQPQAPAASAPAQPQAPAASAPAAAQAAPEQQAPKGAQRLVVTAREACWVFAKADGDRAAAVDIVLQPGQSHTLFFRKDLELKLGNAGGVSVTFNGEKVALQAQSGQVRTLNFTAP
ncbi:helix-turn-helix domain-containing protein [Desulfocurvus vexinensis]|uniref:helix-turn-helix domain-containing protein n=1 Tax=Desulfocurvus vexinensis TaxID=399548 RepID=UPI0004AF8FFD|nr:helix-turn-helix domain-containing protein [Desulfocurvus vexinensis]